MKHHMRLAVSLISVLLLFACCSDDERKTYEFDRLCRTIDSFYAAVENGDTQARLDLFTPDAMMLPNYGEIIQLDDSAKAILKSYDADWVFRIKDLEREEIYLDKKIAYTVNTYFYTFHRKYSEPEWHKTKNVHIWKKQEDGSWKLHIDIWNSSVKSH